MSGKAARNSPVQRPFLPALPACSPFVTLFLVLTRPMRPHCERQVFCLRAGLATIQRGLLRWEIMLPLAPDQIAELQHWFLPDRPGSLVGSHVRHTCNGAGWVDRWPMPRTVLMESAGNYASMGDVHALTPADLRRHLKGVVEAPEAFAPLLRATFPMVRLWPRVIRAQPDGVGQISPCAYPLRRLVASDAIHLEALEPASTWISKTWGGPYGLAQSGYAWGAFVAGQLAAVACTFFLGATYEDIGIVTRPQFQGWGLVTACTAALCHDIRARGHRPSWSTSLDNAASIRVAEKLGFVVHRHDLLYVVGVDIPEPASRFSKRRPAAD